MSLDMATTSNARSPYVIDVGNGKVVKLQLKASAYSASLLGKLGITALPASGAVPDGKTLVGNGRIAAAQNGCFSMNLVYSKTATRTQQARVMCSPTKADTAFTEVRGDTYGGSTIIEGRVPRRRVYTF
jgi:hypothetical protein